MIIRKVEPIHLRIPFRDGGSGTGLFPSAWTHLDIVLVRIEADNGLVGWGEGFGSSCGAAVAAMITDALSPMLVNRDIDNPAECCDELQRRTVLPGRYGITTFAISGVDIALWDLVAKMQGVPLSSLRPRLPDYLAVRSRRKKLLGIRVPIHRPRNMAL